MVEELKKWSKGAAERWMMMAGRSLGKVGDENFQCFFGLHRRRLALS